MKRLVKLFALVGLLVAVCYTATGCIGGSSDTSVTPPAEQSTLVESAHEIPEETLNAIRRELRGYFYNFDDNSIISVSDCNGALDSGLYYAGMVLRVPFPDYVNALSVQSTELAAEYGEDIYKISVQFTGGYGKSITWDSSDGVSGNLTDTYEDTLSLSGQTVEDLVERYGCMNWFYDLSDNATQSRTKDNAPSAFGDKLDVFQGTWGDDGPWQIVVCLEDVYFVCYDKGKIVEVKEYHFCFYGADSLAIAIGKTPKYLFSIDDSGKLVSEKISNFTPIINTYEKISDDTSVPAQ